MKLCRTGLNDVSRPSIHGERDSAPCHLSPRGPEDAG